MNFGTGDFTHIILRRRDGSSMSLALGEDVRRQVVDIGQAHGRTVISITLEADVQRVQYEPAPRQILSLDGQTKRLLE